MSKLESAVIVKNDFGVVATLRFDNPKLDTFISATKKKVLYILIEKYVKRVTADE